MATETQPTVPSLSEAGWITDPAIILAKLLGYYLMTDGAQSIAYRGQLINLPGTYRKYINEPEQLSLGIRADILTLLGRYFSNVDVETSVVNTSPAAANIMLFAIVVTDTGEQINLGKVVQMNIDNITKVLDISNLGDGLQALNTL